MSLLNGFWTEIKIIHNPMKSRINIYRILTVFTGALIFILLFMSVINHALCQVFPSMREFVGEYICSIVGILALLISGISLRLSYCINETLKISELRGRYAENEMLDDLRALRMVVDSWKSDGGPCYCKRMYNENFKRKIRICNRDKFVFDFDKQRKLPWTKEQDQARRRIKFWYLSAYKIYSNHSVCKQAFLEIIDTDSISLLFEVIEPMECLINENYDWVLFYNIMKQTNKDFWEKKETQVQAHSYETIYRG